MDFLAEFFAKHRLFLASLVTMATLGSAVGVFRLRIDSDPRAMLNAEDLQAGPLRELEANFGANDTDCVIVLETEDFISPVGVQVVNDLVTRALKVEGVERVVSMLSVRGNIRVSRYVAPLLPPSADASAETFEKAKQAAHNHPLLTNRLLSADRTTSLVIVRLAGNNHSENRIRQFVSALQVASDEATAGTPVTAALTGLPVLRLEMISALMRDQLKFNITAMSAGGIVCFLVFQSIRSTYIVMVSSMTGVLWTLGLMGWMGVPLNMITTVIAPLVLVLGVSDAIHLYLEIRRAAHEGQSPVAAAQAGIRNVGLACAVTSLTTFAGFGSLRLASLDVIRVFGSWAAIGCALNYVAIIVMVPLLATTLPSSKTDRTSSLVEKAIAPLGPLLWAITRWRWAVVITTVIVTIGLFLLGLSLHAENRLTETIPTKEQAYQALLKCDNRFGGALMASAIVQWPKEAFPDLIPVLTEVHAAIDRQPHIHNPTSLLNLLQSRPGTSPDLRRRIPQLRYLPREIIHQFMNQEKTHAVVDARIPDVGSSVLSPEFAALEADFQQITEKYPQFSIHLTGGSVPVVSQSAASGPGPVDKPVGRSAGDHCRPIARFPFHSSGRDQCDPECLSTRMRQCGAGHPGRPLEISSVVVFSMCLGIATDDTIHFLVRFQRENDSSDDPAAAVRRAIDVVGEAIVVTTVLLTIGFCSFMFSGIPALQNVGQLACVALLAALVGDLVVLPSLILLVYQRRGSSTR